ncbi:hypothetical protein [Kiloniella sp.]|uniref:hypothetical protein n=1 Tax=Kiloniella sp. TaxID=1938587 RepID=UPI003A94446A
MGIKESTGKLEPTKQIDFTDHIRPDIHEHNPHQHEYTPNPTGGTPRRGGAGPLKLP